MKLTESQKRWIRLTKKIERLERLVVLTKAERAQIKSPVMEDLKCWGLRDEAITNRLKAA